MRPMPVFHNGMVLDSLSSGSGNACDQVQAHAMALRHQSWVSQLATRGTICKAGKDKPGKKRKCPEVTTATQRVAFPSNTSALHLNFKAAHGISEDTDQILKQHVPVYLRWKTLFQVARCSIQATTIIKDSTHLNRQDIPELESKHLWNSTGAFSSIQCGAQQ